MHHSKSPKYRELPCQQRYVHHLTSYHRQPDVHAGLQSSLEAPTAWGPASGLATSSAAPVHQLGPGYRYIHTGF